MSDINMPKAPGYFISKWREEGPVDIETSLNGAMT